MSEQRKKQVWPWIVALLVGLPVLYVASFGPACWVSSRAMFGQQLVATTYRPVLAFLSMSGDHPPIDRAILWYATVGAAPGYKWFFEPLGDEPNGYNDWEWGPRP